MRKHIGYAAFVVACLAAVAAAPATAMAECLDGLNAGATFDGKVLTVMSGEHELSNLTTFSLGGIEVRGGKLSLGGIIDASSLRVSGGTLVASSTQNSFDEINISNGKLTVGSGARFTCKNLKVSGGSLTSKSTVYVMDSMKVSGGTVTVSTSKAYEEALYISDGLRLSGGAISIRTTGRGAGGLSVGTEHFKMTGGKLTVLTKGKLAEALYCYADAYISKGSVSLTAKRADCLWVSDKLTVKKGAKVKIAAAKGNYAFRSFETASVAAGTLKCSSGSLMPGVKFTKNGRTYKVLKGPKVIGGKARAMVVKQVKGKKLKSKTVTYGKVKYYRV